MAEIPLRLVKRYAKENNTMFFRINITIHQSVSKLLSTKYVPKRRYIYIKLIK